MSVLARTVAGRRWLTWQQSPRDPAIIAVAFRGMVIPLQPASVLGLEAKQSPVAQSEAHISAAITTSARTTVTGLCHEIRVCALPFMACANNFVAIINSLHAAGCALRHSLV